MTRKAQDVLAWLLVATWLTLGGLFVAGCRDQHNPPPREPYPLRSAWQDAPKLPEEVI